MADYIDRELVLRQLDEKYISAIVQQKHDDATEEHKKLWKGIQSGVNYARNIVSEAPTKDVVPKSEYDDLFTTLEAECERLEKVEENFHKAKQDVAREISRDIIEPLWEAYKKSEDKATVLLVALICESINAQLKNKYIGE